MAQNSCHNYQTPRGVILWSAFRAAGMFNTCGWAWWAAVHLKSGKAHRPMTWGLCWNMSMQMFLWNAITVTVPSRWVLPIKRRENGARVQDLKESMHSSRHLHQNNPTSCTSPGSSAASLFWRAKCPSLQPRGLNLFLFLPYCFAFALKSHFSRHVTHTSCLPSCKVCNLTSSLSQRFYLGSCCWRCQALLFSGTQIHTAGQSYHCRILWYWFWVYAP